VEAFLERLPEHVIVTVDEAYTEYVDEPDYPDTIPWVERFPNLVVTRTFSKAYGLAGCGWVCRVPSTSSKSVKPGAAAFQRQFSCPDSAIAALGDDEHLQRSRQVNREGMILMKSALAEMDLRYLHPSAISCASIWAAWLEIFEHCCAGSDRKTGCQLRIANFLRITIAPSGRIGS